MAPRVFLPIRMFVTLLTRKLRVPSVLSLCALACVLDAPGALAADTAAADAAFQEGRALMAAGDLAAACARFEDSRRFEAAVGTELNLGECYERLGRLASAQRAFLAGAAMAEQLGQPERARRAQERAASLAERMSTITLVVPSQAHALTLLLDGTPLPRTQWGAATPLDPGTHSVEARAPGQKPWSVQIVVRDRAERVSVTVPELATQPAVSEPPALAPAAPVHADAQPPRAFRAARIGLFSGGALTLIAGGALGLRAWKAWDRRNTLCDGDICERAADRPTRQAQRAANWSTGLCVTGAAALSAGLSLWAFGPRGSQASLRVAPHAAELSFGKAF
jgi:hypothetical protein